MNRQQGVLLGTLTDLNGKSVAVVAGKFGVLIPWTTTGGHVGIAARYLKDRIRAGWTWTPSPLMHTTKYGSELMFLMAVRPQLAANAYMLPTCQTTTSQ